ncbi:MAG: ATP-grasp domain-containing protein [Francisellaceae bacterium]|jgi:3-methylcrotonyl-CoA carboxylase alpha subunit|nr:ATP-grasp domain-containing protein [Francisellaceae bacterium]
MFNRILIANRGEIACRIIKTLRELNICSIAVYSYADKYSKHALIADEAYCLGNSPAVDSYLNIDKIVSLAKKYNIDAVHPGYGFLSENSNFAKTLESAGIKFIGPTTKTIEVMGNKALAKEFMKKAMVPLLPGGIIKDDNSNLDNLVSMIGYPMLIKASCGGGGKGMRIVYKKSELIPAIESCRREALGAFGDSCLLAEKFLTAARHIEIQIAADQQGNVIHLFERDCSLQRRHQKVIEEAPAIDMNQEIKEKMFACVTHATNQLGYEGVGTFEFLVEDNAFYFLEVNTRLQVEHPVTEMITGIDIVKLQIEIANGIAIPFTQNEISNSGHAIECRIYAEDPANDFLPATGTIEYIQEQTATDIRIDNGVTTGTNVSMFYDPMLSKVIAYGKDRDTAVNNLSDFLNNYAIFGLTNNITFLRQIISSNKFRNFSYNTQTLDNNDIDIITAPDDVINKALIIATMALQVTSSCLSLRVNSSSCFKATLGFNSEIYNLEAILVNVASWQIITNNCEHNATDITIENNSLSMKIDGEFTKAYFHITETNCFLTFAKYDFNFTTRGHYSIGINEHDENIITSPMSGVIRQVNAQNGDKVKTGTVVIVLEAMKMEHSISIGKTKTINAITCKVGDFVSTGQVLINMSED